jgi:hypothetical protein
MIDNILSFLDICLLPKDEGTCENRTEKYYFDSKTQTCLTFEFSCDGNLNNFDSKEQCEKLCLSKQETILNKDDQIPSTTTTIISNTTQAYLTPIDPNIEEN